MAVECRCAISYSSSREEDGANRSRCAWHAGTNASLVVQFITDRSTARFSSHIRGRTRRFGCAMVDDNICRCLLQSYADSVPRFTMSRRAASAPLHGEWQLLAFGRLNAIRYRR